MAQQILPTIDFRTQAERQGITKNQQTAQAIAGILQTIGNAEQNRQERITLERITKVISEAGTLDAISQAAKASPVFSEGLRGGLQRFAGAFSPSPGGVGQGIQSSIINAALQQALTPQQPFSLGPEQTRFSGKGVPIAKGQPKAITPSQQIAQKQLDRINELETKSQAGTATEAENTALAILRGEQKAPLVQIDMGKPASAGERTDIAQGRASIDALDNLKTLFDNPRTETGPVKGRISPIAGLVGMTTDEQESFMAATSAFKNAIIKEITGAQMSEVEAERIMKQVPDITDPPRRWQAKWEQSKKNLEFLQKRRLEVLQQSGIRAPEDIPEDEIGSASIEELMKAAGIADIDAETLATVPESRPQAPSVGQTPVNKAKAAPKADISDSDADIVIDSITEPNSENDFKSTLTHISSQKVAQKYFEKWSKKLKIKENFEDLWKSIGSK